MSEHFYWRGRYRPVEIIHLPDEARGWTPPMGPDARFMEYTYRRRDQHDQWKLIEAYLAEEGPASALGRIPADLVRLVRDLLGLGHREVDD